MANPDPVRVLVIDDSALIRKILTRMLSEAPGIEVVGTAVDPFDAREKIKHHRPDVLTLDVEMPRMDGITFLRNLMRLRPMPVVMVSTLTEAGADVTLQALELGAIDFVTKPSVDVAHGLEAYAQELASKIHTAAKARLQSHAAATGRAASERPPPAGPQLRTSGRILALGASTGGTEALRAVLETLPPDIPGTVITQHIPAGFSAAFAARMDRSTALRVKEAEDGDVILPGHVFIAPGTEYHLQVARDGARFVCRVTDGEPVRHHRPSVDVLFESLARAAGGNSTAALLTGMGDDGARGLLALRQAGSHTIAQDEASSLVWGMPGEAVKRGAAIEVLPLERIAAALIRDPRSAGATSE